MADWNVFVTRDLPGGALDRLRQECGVMDLNAEDRVLTPEEILAGVKGRDGVLCLLTDTREQVHLVSNPTLCEKC